MFLYSRGNESEEEFNSMFFLHCVKIYITVKYHLLYIYCLEIGTYGFVVEEKTFSSTLLCLVPGVLQIKLTKDR